MRISTQIKQLLCTIGLAIATSACQKSTQIQTNYSSTSTSSGSASETLTVRSSEQFPIVASEPNRHLIDIDSEESEPEESDRNSIRIENHNGSHSSVRVETGNGDRRRNSFIFNSTRSSGAGSIIQQNTDPGGNYQFISIGSHQLEFNYDLQSDGVNLNFDLWQDDDLDGEKVEFTAVVRTPSGQTQTIDLDFDRGQKRKTVFIPGRESGLYQVTVEAQIEGGRLTNSFTFDRQ
jgi:hypothetical protein